MELMIEHLGKGLFFILMLSLPAVLTAASVGLIVGILQAVTQVQEQTISAAPKVLLVFLLIIFGGGLMLNILTNYIREASVIAFNELNEGGGYLRPAQEIDERRARLKHFFEEEAKRPKRHMTLPSSKIGQGSDPTDQQGSAHVSVRSNRDLTRSEKHYVNEHQ